MDAARDLSNWRSRAAALLHRARSAVRLTGPIDDRIGLGNVRTRLLERTPLAAQGVSLRAAVFVSLLVPLELAAGQRLVVALPPFPHRHMRLDAFGLDHPRQHWRRPVGGVADQPLRGEREAPLDPI